MLDRPWRGSRSVEGLRSPVLLALVALLAACRGPAPLPPAQMPAAPPTSRESIDPPPGDDLCPSLCAVHPTSTSPQAAPLREPIRWEGPSGAVSTVDNSLVLLFWREPNGESIEAIGALNDLARQMQSHSVRKMLFALVYVGNDVAQATQARRELIDRDLSVGLLYEAQAQALVAALSPDRTPTTYVLDQAHRPRVRFDSVQSWKSPATPAFFEGIVAGRGCGLVFDAGKVSTGGRCDDPP